MSMSEILLPASGAGSPLPARTQGTPDVPPDMVELLPIAAYACDADGRLLWFNQRAARLWGRVPPTGKAGELFCGAQKLYIDGRLIDRHASPMAQALARGEAVEGLEAVMERPDGSRSWVAIQIAPALAEDGGVIGAIACLADTTESQRAKELALSRSKQAEQAAITQQRVLLDELNHRIKNNMQVLHSLLSAAQSETTNEDARTILANASQRVAAMAAAQRVLYGSRDPTQFDAKAFLEAVCRTAQQAFEKIFIECNAVAAWLSNDAAMPLALILNELLSNAVRHGIGSRPGGTIRIGLASSPQGYDLYVEDDGPGFDLAEARRRSSGLGLVGGLARQLGGSFRVERRPGARCSVSFPG